METTNEISKFIDKWDYSTYFREYLLLLASKKDLGLESKNNFPEKIQLSYGWHKMLNKVRDKTDDGNEYWGFVGFKEDKRNLWFPNLPAKGYDSYVPGELIKLETNKARDKFGIVDLLGDAHSHPTDFFTKVKQHLPNRNSYGLKAAFSAGDLFIVVNTEHFRPFIAVVEGDCNLFAFRTRETKGLGVSSHIFNQDSFEKYWYEKNGYKYLGGVKMFGANRATPVTDSANPYGVNIDIAERHSLVIYQGMKGKDIKRVYPL